MCVCVCVCVSSLSVALNSLSCGLSKPPPVYWSSLHTHTTGLDLCWGEGWWGNSSTSLHDNLKTFEHHTQYIRLLTLYTHTHTTHAYKDPLTSMLAHEHKKRHTQIGSSPNWACNKHTQSHRHTTTQTTPRLDISFHSSLPDCYMKSDIVPDGILH